ncbi:MAG: DNA translocase FtsK [Thermoanaerobaculia bacterium]
MSEPRRDLPRVEISPDKGREIVGVLFAATAVISGASLASYDPSDPSFLRQISGPAPTHNWIGGLGAEIAAAGFGILGVTCLLIPLLLAVAAWRRLRPKIRPKVVGRGAGALLMLLSLPALLQLLVPSLVWRSEAIDSGGAVGTVLAGRLAGAMNFAGALVLLLALCIVGVALLVQTSLGEAIARWRRRFAGALDQWRLSRARRHERQEKERSRKRVVVKHLQRVAEEKQERLDKLAGVASGSAARRAAVADVAEQSDEIPLPPVDGKLDLPMRGTPRPQAERPVTVRRVSAPSIAAAGGGGSGGAGSAAVSGAANAAFPPAESPVRREKQKEFGFVDTKSDPELPPLNLLQLENEKPTIDEDELVRLGEAIRSRCEEFGVEGTIEGIGPGPVITVFEFQPAPGVKVSQIVNLQDDLALALKAESVRIDRIPGRSTLGMEVPNPKRAVIRLGAMLANESFRKSPSLLSLAIGMTIHGEPYYADLATMPHLLIAGATGSGKSIGLQSLITSILYKATRDQVQFIFIDPKRIELGVYADIPHLKTEVVVEPKKAANALRWAVAEMERRYKLLAEVHVRSIDFYNRAIRDPEVRNRLSLTEGEGPIRESDLKPLPYYVIIIDELADLMMVSAAEVETSIARLAQMARAVGIHLIVATQRPSVDILTGTIKANFPCRLSFATASRHDSRTILDGVGAEKLLGKGDMLFLPPGSSRPIRLHGPYISEQETASLVRWLKKQGKPELDPAVLAGPEEGGNEGGAGPIDDDLFDQAARLVVQERQASASFLQRRMRVGFSRAARLIDMMEREGLLGPSQGSKPRDVLVPQDYFSEVDETRNR